MSAAVTCDNCGKQVKGNSALNVGWWDVNRHGPLSGDHYDLCSLRCAAELVGRKADEQDTRLATLDNTR